jgi:hypothetical protein
MVAPAFLFSAGAQELPVPVPRRLGEFAGPRLPPVRDLPLQIQNLKFYLGEPAIVILDKIFEPFVRRYHP